MARRDRTVAMRTRAHAHAPPDRRCASKAGAPPEPQPALVHCRPHPRGSRATTRAIGAGAAALALALARTLARCARRGCRGSDRARGAGQAAAEGRRPRRLPRHTYGPAGARREGGRLEEGIIQMCPQFLSQISNFWASHCLVRVIKVKTMPWQRARAGGARRRGARAGAAPRGAEHSAAPLQAPSRSHCASGLVS